MIEAIRTFFGRLRGVHSDRRVIVEEGRLWHCTKCRLLFVTKQEAERHKCMEANL